VDLVQVEGTPRVRNELGYIEAFIRMERAFVKTCMMVVGVEVVINVSSFEDGAGGGAWVVSRRKTIDRHKPDGLHESTAGKSDGFCIVLSIVSDMLMSTKELDRSVPVAPSGPNLGEDGLILWGMSGDVSSDEEEIDLFVANSLLKPIFFDGLLHALHDGIIIVAGEVEEEAESYDTNPLLFSSKFLISGGQRDQLLGLRVNYIDIRGEIATSEIGYGDLEFGFGGVLFV
jgi:hypothetical protein